MELQVIVTQATTNSQKTQATVERSISYEQQFREKTGKDFNVFYSKYYTKLVWIIQRMNINSIDAEGLANDAFMQSLNKIEMYNPQYHFSTWLFDIGKKMAYQYKKDQKKLAICVDMSSGESNDEDNVYDPVQAFLKNKIDTYDTDISTQKLMNLKYNETLKEISNLNPKYKRIIELSDVQGKTYNEICEILGDDLGTTPEQRLQTVKNRLHHGRIKLENNLKTRFSLIEQNY